MPSLRRAAAVAALAWLAIEIHEAGHWLAYRALGHAVRLGFQRVTPVGAVPAAHDLAARLAGPLLGLAAAAACLAVARRRPGFGWATAALANASLRLFPLAMDLARALRGGRPFSDEGQIGVALGLRLPTLLAFLAASSALTLLSARLYRFERARGAKVALVYLGCLAVGVAAVLFDDLLGLNPPQ